MRRLRLLFRGGATVDVDVGDAWNLETDLLRFPPPDDMWRERLRYLSSDDVVGIVELREPPEFEER
jgi:hypothetical protein